MRTLTTVASLFAVGLVVSAASAQSVVTLYPTADAHTRDIAPNENNGSSEVLWIGRGVFFGLGNVRTFTRFDLLNLLPANSNVINAATLSAYQFDTEPAAGGLDTNVHAVTGNWSESAVTWANQPTFDAQVWATARTGDSFYEGFIDWDVTDLVQTQVMNAAHSGWMFKNTFEGAGASRLGYFHSREFMDNPARRVQLNVEIAAGDAPDMTLSYDILVSGSDATLVADGATPGTRVYFIYSLTGLGTTNVNQLNVTLGLRAPSSIGSAIAGNSGQAVFTQRIPQAAAGRNVWIQAAHTGAVSNITAARIR